MGLARWVVDSIAAHLERRAVALAVAEFVGSGAMKATLNDCIPQLRGEERVSM